LVAIQEEAKEFNEVSKGSPESETLKAVNAGCQKVFKNAKNEYDKLKKSQPAQAVGTSQETKRLSKRR